MKKEPECGVKEPVYMVNNTDMNIETANHGFTAEVTMKFLVLPKGIKGKFSRTALTKKLNELSEEFQKAMERLNETVKVETVIYGNGKPIPKQDK